MATYALSAARIDVREPRFEASELPYDAHRFEELRRRRDVFAFRRKHVPLERQIVAIPLDDHPVPNLPDPTTFITAQHLPVLAQLIEVRLPVLFPELSLRWSKHGVDSLHKSEDLIAMAAREADLADHPLLHRLHIYSRTRFRVQHATIAGSGPYIALAIDLRPHHHVDGSAADLIDAGGVLTGIKLMSSTHTGEQMLGTVDSVDAHTIQFRSGDTADARMCRIDASPASFAKLLDRAVGARSRTALDNAISTLTAEMFGRGYMARLRDTVEHLKTLSPRAVAARVSIAVGDPFMLAPESGTTTLPQIERRFGEGHASTKPSVAAELAIYGPVDAAERASSPISIAFVTPNAAAREVRAFATRLCGVLSAKYRLGTVSSSVLSVEVAVSDREAPEASYAGAITTALGDLPRPDAFVVVIDDDDATARNPFFAAKLAALRAGVPSQQLRLSKLLVEPARLLPVVDGLAVSLFGKLGRTPWTIATNGSANDLVIGLASSGRNERGKPVYAPVAVLFSGDGRFLLGRHGPYSDTAKHPAALGSLVARSIIELQTRVGWTRGERVRVTCHAIIEQVRGDFAAIRTAIEALDIGLRFEVRFVAIAKDQPFRVVGLEPHVPDRGVVVDMGKAKSLLCVHGTELVDSDEGTPYPLLVELTDASESVDFRHALEDVYAFTGAYCGGLDPIAEPATTYYARMLVGMISRAGQQLDGLSLNHLWFA